MIPVFQQRDPIYPWTKPVHWVKLRLDYHATLLVKDFDATTQLITYKIVNNKGIILEGPKRVVCQLLDTDVRIGPITIPLPRYHQIISTLED